MDAVQGYGEGGGRCRGRQGPQGLVVQLQTPAGQSGGQPHPGLIQQALLDYAGRIHQHGQPGEVGKLVLRQDLLQLLVTYRLQGTVAELAQSAQIQQMIGGNQGEQGALAVGEQAGLYALAGSAGFMKWSQLIGNGLALQLFFQQVRQGGVGYHRASFSEWGWVDLSMRQ